MKPISGFDGYLVTREGRVWSKTRKDRRGVPHGGHWVKPMRHRNNHLFVRLCKNGVHYNRYVHRLVLEAYVGPCPEGMECCHNNGDPLDNRLENLRWDTRSANIKDAIKQGTYRVGESKVKGSANGFSKLTEQQARQIIYIHRTGLFTQKEIANQFRVCKLTIQNIIHRRSWKHLWA